VRQIENRWGDTGTAKRKTFTLHQTTPTDMELQTCIASTTGRDRIH